MLLPHFNSNFIDIYNMESIEDMNLKLVLNLIQGVIFFTFVI